MAIAVHARATSPFVPRQLTAPSRTTTVPSPPRLSDRAPGEVAEVVTDPLEEPPRSEAESKHRVDLEILKRTIARREDSTAPPRVAPEPQETTEPPEPPVATQPPVTTEPPVTTQPPPGDAQATRTLEITVERRVELSLDVQVERLELRRAADAAPALERKDPLVLDLDGDGVELTTAADGVLFDLDADGALDRAAFATGDDAFLARDRDGDGRITSGAELFGDLTGARDGFADLARMDANGDGQVDAADPGFDALRLVSTAGTRTLADAGVTAISVEGQAIHRERADGNAEVAQSTFTRRDGSTGRVADVLLAYQRSALG